MRYIVEVARSETITVAAETLGLTQPAVTRSIAEVEAELKTKLFYRTSKGMTLTRTGEHFVRHAKRIIEDVNDLISEIRDGTHEMGGRLRIAAAPAGDILYAQRSLCNFAAEYPTINIEIVTGSVEELCPRLLRGEIDGIVGASTDLIRWRELRVKTLCKLHFGCMVRQNHPITEMHEPCELDMLRFPLLLPTSVEAIHTPLAQRYSHYRELMQPQYSVDNPILLKALIKSTDAFHPLHHIDPKFSVIRREFEVVTGLVTLPERQFSIAWAALHTKSRVMQLFQKQLEKDFSPASVAAQC